MDTEYQDNLPAPRMKPSKSGGFESMNLIPAVYQAIKRKGFNVPTPIQRKTIPLILNGHDIVACSKTGSGKTAAFVVPLINKLKEHSNIVGVRGLIVLPTRELALQTASVIKFFARGTNLVHTLLLGGHGFEGQFESLAMNPDILIVTPGRLTQHLVEGRISLSRVEMVIFDEADYLFEMGLADQLKQILSYLPPTRQSLIFSATIPEQLSLFAQVGLKDYVYVKLDKEFSLPENMMIHFMIVGNENKLASLVMLMRRFGPEETSIIFASTKYLVDLIVYTLERFQIEAVNIYGKMDQIDRKEQLSQFRSQKAKVLVVTDLAARGIDIPQVDNVIHFDYPAKPKIFIHRSGRTARAGRKGTVYTLLAHDEVYFIHETMLFAGRKLVSEGDLEDTTKAFYGKIPVEAFANLQAQIEFLHKEDPEFSKLQEVSRRANEKFRKTRGSASRASIRNVKNLNLKVNHPFFVQAEEEETKNMMEAIKNFKPSQSAIELKRIQALRSKVESGKDNFLTAVRDLKKIQRQKVERRLKKQSSPQNGEQPEDDEDGEFDNIEIENTNNWGHIEEHEDAYVPQSNHKPQQQVKKCQQKTFKHPTQFMSNEKDYTKKSEFDDLNKIQMHDVNAFVIAEDMEGLHANRKRRVWDVKKKRYVTGKKDEAGEIRKDREDKFLKDEKIKNTFHKWRKRNLMNIQQAGEREDEQTVQRAKQMFERRRLIGRGFHFNDDKKRGVRNEIKNNQQLLKGKKIKKNKQLKNMRKEQRKGVEQKMRSFKENYKQKRK